MRHTRVAFKPHHVTTSLQHTPIAHPKLIHKREELAAREEPTTGNKAWLRRRLHAAIVRNCLASPL